MTNKLRSGLVLAFLVAFVAPLVLAGCATTPAVRVEPHPVKVTVTKYVPLPAALTVPCIPPVSAPTIKTNADLLNAYLQDAASLSQCAAQVEAIRKLQP